jgi:hypothetical protein
MSIDLFHDEFFDERPDGRIDIHLGVCRAEELLHPRLLGENDLLVSVIELEIADDRRAGRVVIKQNRLPGPIFGAILITSR